MKITRLWLPILAASVLTLPLAAQQIDAPSARWQASEPSATLSLLRAPESLPDSQTQAPPPAAGQNPPAAPGASTPKGRDQDSHERALGLAPMFTVVEDASKARPLTPAEKWRLFYRQTYDPFQFVSAAFSAGINQASNSPTEYGQGAKGYAKRYGAGLADNSLGNFFGNFALPSLLHDDPRYFRMGHGPILKRTLYALSATVVTHRDNGTLRPNYSNVAGNLIGCAVGDIYHPASDRTVGSTIGRGLQITAYGGIGGIFSEFMPDIQRRLKRHHEPAPAEKK